MPDIPDDVAGRWRNPDRVFLAGSRQKAGFRQGVVRSGYRPLVKRGIGKYRTEKNRQKKRRGKRNSAVQASRVTNC